MKTFDEYAKENKVKSGSADPAQARSLFGQSAARLHDVKSLPITDQDASFRFESIYECLREALQAFMALEGYKPYSHEATIAFGKDRLFLTDAETSNLDRYREIRSDIIYRGEKITVEEAKEALAFAEQLHQKLSVLFLKR
ncbi:hypothetical protein HYU19_04175 [Candidatus Woesearchaeota archaeon]|nr:hypothetical protein [Candidatus Woesearchaeota archaeon]